VDAAVDLAALASDPVRAALGELAASPTVSGDEPMAALVRAARLRAKDPGTVAAFQKGLASKDAAAVAEALLLAGNARATDLLGAVARLADDARPLPKPVESRWSDTKTETSPDGTVTSTSTPVSLATVGAVALEAANRMCVSTLPEWVAWWYEPEKAERFGRGAEGVRRLKAFVAEDAKAEKAKAIRGLAAVEAVLATIRRGEEEAEAWSLVSATFDRSWTLTGTLGGKPSRHGVAPDGRVTSSRRSGPFIVRSPAISSSRSASERRAEGCAGR
jgi:hypothetical protein